MSYSNIIVYFIIIDGRLFTSRRCLWILNGFYYHEWTWFCTSCSYWYCFCCIKKIIQVGIVLYIYSYSLYISLLHWTIWLFCIYITQLLHRAVILLSPDNPTEALNAFLSKKAALITKKIFDVSTAILYCIIVCCVFI